MKMTRLEKRLVNRRRKGARNIAKIRPRLEELNRDSIRDVLELGCGIGAVSAFLAETYGLNVYATDLDPAQIEIARRMQPESARLRFRVADAARLTFADGSFDLVLSQNVFHHIPDWEAAVQEVTRVLRPGAYFIWLDLACPKLLKKLLGPLARRHGLYTFAEIKSAFVRNGLEPCYYERVAHGPFGHHHLVLQKRGGSARTPL
ncbi:MAG: class I SAM-dependent methyltransferase [Desulfobacterales bacterium]|nr:MAG: class I SAM-dependent methyltransferase [Desulfobacterales bacterium]